MPLTGPQKQQLQAAVLSAFTASDLEQLLAFKLNVQLWRIAGQGPLEQVVFAVIEWCEQQGRTAEFLDAIARARPHNREIQDAVAALRAAGIAPPEKGR
jgi:Effector-associated domain 1